MTDRLLNLGAAALAVSVFASLALLVSGEAHGATADPGVTVPAIAGLQVTAHGVVSSSSLPHCLVDDGGPVVPCSWNVGPGVDGNGVGLSYVVTDHRGVNGSFTFVWASDPRGHGWHWSRELPACVVKAGTYRCPDGAVGRVS